MYAIISIVIFYEFYLFLLISENTISPERILGDNSLNIASDKYLGWIWLLKKLSTHYVVPLVEH